MRVLVADDEYVVRSALRVLLDQEPGVDIVGEVTRAAELLAHVQGECPDLLLLDWELPGRRAASAGGSRQGLLRALRLTCPQLKVIALSVRPDANRTALAAGADAFVSKGDAPEHLLTALHHWRRALQTGAVT
jgi:DNA-binding NarL/FixJ family response regulator